jgi:hypothetical protein
LGFRLIPFSSTIKSSKRIRPSFYLKGEPLQQVARIAKPDTILGWYRKLVAAKFDGSKQRRSPGRPRISSEIEDLVIRLARENSGPQLDVKISICLVRREGVVPSDVHRHLTHAGKLPTGWEQPQVNPTFLIVSLGIMFPTMQSEVACEPAAQRPHKLLHLTQQTAVN